MRNTDKAPECFVAYTAMDIRAFLMAAEQRPEGTPLYIHIRGATLEFPNGLTERAAVRLANYATTLDSSGIGVN